MVGIWIEKQRDYDDNDRKDIVAVNEMVNGGPLLCKKQLLRVFACRFGKKGNSTGA